MIRFLKKYHKWVGVIITLFLVIFSISGIILNHREAFSGIDISRKYLNSDYKYTNWNNAAVKGTEKINKDSILIYGNIGIWLTDSNFNKFTDFNEGLPKGIDNKKTCKILKTKTNSLFAATFFGLYKYNFLKSEWFEISLPIHEKRIVDITETNGKLLIMSRSHILETQNNKDFKVLDIANPIDYKNEASLFKTLWLIHSGEIFGELGKYFVDFIAIIIIFLSITGLIIFINSFRIKKNKRIGKSLSNIKKSNRWNLKWHNKIGWTTAIFVLITTLTGIFLRPPLLIPIANVSVGKIPFSELDSPNPWFDKLRRIFYDNEDKRFIISTLDGFYYSDDNFKSKLKKYRIQAPASIMGVTVFEKISTNKYLIGSFEGVFTWNTKTGNIFDFITNEKYIKPEKPGPPIGKYKITGMAKDYKEDNIFFEFNTGAISKQTNNNFPKMPKIIKEQPISLWNFMLEVHTGRIYSSFLGIFYILVVPLSGLLMTFVLVSGFIVWYKRHRKKKK